MTHHAAVSRVRLVPDALVRAGLLFALGLTACAPAAPEHPTYTEDVRPILSANCVRCHGATPAGGAPSGFRLDRYGFRAGRRGASDVAPFLAERVRVGDMPRFGPGLSGRQTDTLVRWAEQAAGTGGVPALGPPNGAPTIELVQPLPEPNLVGSFPVQLRFEDPDGDAAWARLVAISVAGGDPIVIADDVELGAPWVTLDSATWPVGDTILQAEIGDDGGNEVTVELGRIVVAHAGDRAPIVTWPRPSGAVLFHTAATVRVALDPAQGAGADFVLAVSDDGEPAARVVTVTASLGDTTVTLPAPDAGVITWPLADVPAGTSWRLEATVDDGTHARKATSASFVVVDGTTTETYASIAADVLVPVCGHCHIVDEDFAVPVPLDLRADMIAAFTGRIYRKVVQLEEMPPVSAQTLYGATLDAATRARVRSWLEGGAP